MTFPEVHNQLFINGEWVDGSNDAVDVINPSTGEVIGSIAQGGTKETAEAIAYAAGAFTSWSTTDPKERATVLHRIGTLIEENIDRLALIMTIEQGKPLSQSKAEVQSSADSFHWSAEEARRLYGRVIPAPNGQHFMTVHQPIGVVGAITPWNFPSNMIARKIAPALAAGCTVVLKPASATPYSALALAELFEEAGLPKGAANIVMGKSSDIGKELTSNDTVKKITFTGSTEVGQILNEQSASTLKKVSMELGGHAPFIVFDDADLDQAVSSLVLAKFRNNGQVCTCPNRIFVQKSVKQAFTEKLLVAMKDVKVGLGVEDETVGPLINEEAREHIEDQIKDATSKGATVLYGGKRPEDAKFANGPFYEPTVLDGVTSDMDIYYIETFGPVIPLIEFDTDDEVAEAANDTEFGLASYFFSKNIARISRFSAALEYGMVGVNSMAISQAETPFGGIKHSGFGRENGEEGIREYVYTKSVCMHD